MIQSPRHRNLGAMVHNSESSWNASGTTGSSGNVSFTLNNAASGCYITIVNSLDADGLDWDNVTPESEICK